MAEKPQWQQLVEEEWKNKLKSEAKSQFEFPLIARTYDVEEVVAMTKVILSGQLTMRTTVKSFEQEFAKAVGAKYAVMVNSGSSANLLALAVAANHMRTNQLKHGDEVLVPAVCWSTSLFPIIQLNLKPVLVDSDPKTLNIDLNDLKKKITPKTKGLFLVHVLGNCADMDKIMEIVKEHNLILIEDTCESLQSKYKGKILGTFGDFGTYSFYYSHHITTGEGGMVVCQTEEDYDLLKCLRAHGWTRELSNKDELERQYPDVDPRFLFVNLGFNLRPMEVQAAMGLCQLVKLTNMNKTRNYNRDAVMKAVKSHPNYHHQIDFVSSTDNAEPCWFGLCCLIAPEYKHQMEAYLKYLTSVAVENRPIISGNFARQPIVRKLFPELLPEHFPGSEVIGSRGFFIGLHVEPLPEEVSQFLANKLVTFDWKKIFSSVNNY